MRRIPMSFVSILERASWTSPGRHLVADRCDRTLLCLCATSFPMKAADANALCAAVPDARRRSPDERSPPRSSVSSVVTCCLVLDLDSSREDVRL
jgi:hypothetical protein